MEGIFYMNNDIGYCNAWPAPLKEAWKKRNKLRCRKRCLESNLDRIGYDDFDDLFIELDKVDQELQQACHEFDMIYQRYCPAVLR